MSVSTSRSGGWLWKPRRRLATGVAPASELPVVGASLDGIARHAATVPAANAASRPEVLAPNGAQLAVAVLTAVSEILDDASEAGAPGFPGYPDELRDIANHLGELAPRYPAGAHPRWFRAHVTEHRMEIEAFLGRFDAPEPGRHRAEAH